MLLEVVGLHGWYGESKVLHGLDFVVEQTLLLLHLNRAEKVGAGINSNQLGGDVAE